MAVIGGVTNGKVGFYGTCKSTESIEKGRQSFLEALNARNAEYYKQIDGFRKELRKVEDDLRDTTRQRQEAQQQIDSMNANRARLLQEFDQLKNTRWDTGKEICPTCGQKIPADAVEKAGKLPARAGK